jgi:hypothetical protein
MQSVVVPAPRRYTTAAHSHCRFRDPGFKALRDPLLCTNSRGGLICARSVWPPGLCDIVPYGWPGSVSTEQGVAAAQEIEADARETVAWALLPPPKRHNSRNVCSVLQLSQSITSVCYIAKFRRVSPSHRTRLLLQASYSGKYTKIRFLPHRKYTVAIAKTRQLMMCKEIVAFRAQMRLCGQGAEFLN